MLYLLASTLPYKVCTFLSSSQSALLATKILTTSEEECSLIWFSQLSTLAKDFSLVMEYVRMIPEAPLQQVWVMVLYLSCPAVSQICIFSLLPPICNDLILKSTPMVAIQLALKEFSQKRIKTLVLPTPVSPTMMIFDSSSSGVFIIIEFKEEVMSKFFLQLPKPQSKSSDYRILAFREMQKALKKFKSFQIQRTIKKLKVENSKAVEDRLAALKHISPSSLNKLTLHLLNQNQVELQTIKVFLEKAIGSSIQDAIDEAELELTKPDSILFKENPLYERTKQHITGLKKKDKSKQKAIKQRESNKPTNKQSQPHPSTKKTQESKTPPKGQIKIRYSIKPVSLTSSQIIRAPQLIPQKSKPPSEMHPSWAAKKQETAIVPFAGKKISLI